MAWRRWNGAYVAAVVTLFVFLLSRNLLYAAVAAAIFGALAWIFRARDQSAEPIMLAIAAVTLSTLHQSSLGSLYLLIPNMLAPQWWSPVMPVYFFLSSIVAGTALVILIDMWIAKGWRRPLQITRLLARTGSLHAVDRRVGDFGRADRRDNLSLRPGRPSFAGSLQTGAQRGRIESMTPELWLEAHSYLRPSPTCPHRLPTRRPGSTSSTPACPTGRITARTFLLGCRCCRAPTPLSISNQVGE